MKNKLPLSIIVVISIVLGSSLLTRGHLWGDDFAWYIMQAKSIVEGTTDEFMQTSIFTNTQSSTHVGPTAYPWGYPLLLVPSYVIKGINPLTLKLPAVAFYAAFLVSLYLLVKTRLDETESLLIVALFAFNPLLLHFLDQILSDIPFLFFSTLSLWLMIKNNQRGMIQNIQLGASIYFVVFMRATGILLLGCFLLVEFFELLIHRKGWDTFKKIVWESFIVCASFIALWIVAALVFPNGGASYLSQYAGMTVEQVKAFAVEYFNIYSSFFGEAAGWKYLYYVLVVFFAIGAWRRWRDELIFVLFFVFWMMIHIPYPYWQGARYIFPLLPIFVYFTFVGMKFALGKLPDRFHQMGQWSLYGFWSIIAIVFLFISSTNAYGNLQSGREVNGPFDPYSKEVYTYIQEETSADSVVVFFKPRVMKLMTGRDSIMSTDCEHMLNGDVLVLSRKVGKNQQIPPEEIDACNLPLKQLIKNNRFIVYKIQK
jgi:hypothetical protein